MLWVTSRQLIYWGVAISLQYVYAIIILSAAIFSMVNKSYNQGFWLATFQLVGCIYSTSGITIQLIPIIANVFDEVTFGYDDNMLVLLYLYGTSK